MSLTVSAEIIAATQTPSLQRYRQSVERMAAGQEMLIDTSKLDPQSLDDLMAAAHAAGDAKTSRAIESILLAQSGKFDRAVPNFKAFKGVLEAFLKSDCIDGWIYVAGKDNRLYPQLVTSISYDDGYRKVQPSVCIHTTSIGFFHDNNGKPQYGVHHSAHSFFPQAVAKRRVADILVSDGIYKETQALRDAHMASIERHHKVTKAAFAQQFRVTGTAYYSKGRAQHQDSPAMTSRRVIHDLKPTERGPVQFYADSYIFADNADSGGVGPVPEQPVIRVFDLHTHGFFWVHADYMQPYEYDKSLRDKLILPATHRDLLDVLTADIGAFVNDLIEGKSAGNVILCKGIPGVGKTLSAEVYAELIERPLYSINSGSLGTTAETIAENLEEIFLRAKRWNTVLLLDEADVFVVQRGNNIEQNAIVAEFLRTLEYFDGLLFMTTNRPNDIDEAIISRCAAIIDYAPPEKDATAAVWRVMAEQFQSPLDKELISQLVALFPEITPRDIKMLFRLALRVATAHKTPLSLDTFRRCAMFRAIKMETGCMPQASTPV